MLKSSRSSASSSDDDLTTPLIGDWRNWTAVELAEYLRIQYGMDDYSEVFAHNHITGLVAPNLREDNLKDMGIAILGDRIRLLQALQTLRFCQDMQQHEAILWQGQQQQQVLHGSCCLYRAMLCGCCSSEPDSYTLRSNSLEIKTVLPNQCGPVLCCTGCHCCCCCRLCEPSYEIDTIELWQVVQVHVQGVPPSCCAALCCCAQTYEQVHVYTRESETSSTCGAGASERILVLPQNHGQEIARRIEYQVERTVQRMERV